MAAFGQDEAHALLGLPGIKVICPNAGDAATLEYFSKSMGTQEIEEVSVSKAEPRMLEDMFPRKTLTKKPVEKPRLKLRDLLALRPATPKRPTVETAVLINGKNSTGSYGAGSDSSLLQKVLISLLLSLPSSLSHSPMPIEI